MAGEPRSCEPKWKFPESKVPTRRFSIIITCYNQRDYIGDAVKSAISQGDQLKEVIVVDDASSDGSPEVLSQYAEAIQVIEFPRNRGAPEVRNRALPAPRENTWSFWMVMMSCYPGP